MRNNKHFGISGKGYYIALILCAAAIGISGYLYHENATRAEEVGMMETEASVSAIGTQPKAETKPAATQPEVRPGTKTDTPASTQATTAPTQPAGKWSLKTVSPVSGEEVSGYAMDCLSYNVTTRDWRVHNGVDIAAPEGTEVCAAADGTVYTTYTDDTMGNTVVIRHEGGYTTRYSGMTENLSVKAGDKVSAGQVIGEVGTTALAETALGSHIHFAVSYQDNPMDPGEFLKLG